RRLGFLAIARLIDDEAVARLRELTERILNREIDCGTDHRGGRLRQVLFPRPHPAGVRANPSPPPGDASTPHGFGRADTAMRFNMLFDKPPGFRESTPWHQDIAYSQVPFAPAGTSIANGTLQFWVALDDVDPSSGCMRFLPGLHQGVTLPHHVARGRPDDDS